ncbi:MAG: T9SS type A sorting domain-containing protein [Ignavibacteria bacterium]|nr:T9SS type A sorting domain-containing protein [Ignavibacteriales bacterium]
MKFKKLIFVLCITIFSGLLYFNLSASSHGIVGWTKKNPFEPGCICHNLDPSDSTTVFIQGPSQVMADSSAIFKLFIVKSGLIATGWNVAAGTGEMAIIPGDTISKVLPFIYSNRPDTSIEITQTQPLPANGSDTVIIEFVYKAPPVGNITDTIFANGNAVDLNFNTDGDNWNFAPIFTVDITTVSVPNNNTIVNDYDLSQNYPNPFNPVTNIRFDIMKAGKVRLSVYDITGKEVSVLTNEVLKPGSYEVGFNASHLSSGVYYYRIEAGEFVSVKRMVLLK